MSGSPGSSRSTTLSEWELPYAKWFLGGKLNVAYNCVDRHVEAGLGDRVAYHWEGEPGDTRTITYADLQRDVVRMANALQELGVAKGTRVAIYMGMVPELAVAMLACTRLGAPHTVVFGGFSADSLSDRMNDMGCEVLVTQDEAWRRGSPSPSSSTADEAMAAAPGVHSCLVVRRTGNDVPMTDGRDRWLPRARRLRRPGDVPVRADGQRGPAVPDVHVRHHREAEGDRPHDRRLPRRRRHHPSLRLRPEAETDVFWCAADIGWITGHSYIVYGPLCNGDHVGALRGDARLPRQGSLVGDRRALRRDDPLHRPDRDPRAHEVGPGARRRSTTSRRSGCSARSASRSIPRHGSGTTRTSAASAARSSTRGGRPRRG